MLKMAFPHSQYSFWYVGVERLFHISSLELPFTLVATSSVRFVAVHQIFRVPHR